MPKRRIKVIILMGGPSAEHEVSLATGRQILQHLDSRKYSAEPITITRTGKWILPPPAHPKIQTQNIMLVEALALKKITRNKKPDVVFIALHGKYGEDGTVQKLLEAAGIPYTGSGVLASARGMDKPRSLLIFKNAGIAVPDFFLLTKKECAAPSKITMQKIVKAFSLPVVIKPSDHGSSIGVSIVKKKINLEHALQEAARYSDKVMAQKFIHGREITCGILEEQPGKLMPLPPVEIVPRLGEFYDYASKYNEQGSDHFIPPPGLSPKTLRAIKDTACYAHMTLGCSGISRSDFILGKDKKLYILEINTIPGMTPTSLLPQAAHAAGIDFSKIIDIMIASALLKTKNRRSFQRRK